MRIRPSGILRAGRSQIGQQAMLYLLFSATASLSAAAVTVVLARDLSTEGFAGFTLAKSLLLIVASIFEFGVFFPAARLTALAEEEEERRKWLGAIMVAYIPMGLSFAACIALISLGVDSVLNVSISSALLVTAPLGIAYPFSLVALSISKGTGKAYIQPLLGTIAGVLFFIGALAASVAGVLTLTMSLALKGGGLIVASVVIVFMLKPIFSEVRKRLGVMWKETRRWGMNAYFGRLLAVGSYNIDVLFLGALANAQQVGSYGLATSGANLIGLPAVALATALFRRMAQQEVLDRRPIVILVSWGLSATAVGFALASFIIPRYLNAELDEAAILVIPLGLTATVGAVCTLMASYLNARAAGRELRNTSMALLISNLVFSPALIIPFGAKGAALASLLSMTVTLLAYLHYVRQLENHLVSDQTG